MHSYLLHSVKLKGTVPKNVVVKGIILPHFFGAFALNTCFRDVRSEFRPHLKILNEQALIFLLKILVFKFCQCNLA